MRICFSVCPRIKKQALFCRKNQPGPVQVVVDQQQTAATLCNDMHAASTCIVCSTLADPPPMCVQVLEACCAAAPTTNFDAEGWSLNKDVDNDSNYHMDFFRQQ